MGTATWRRPGRSPGGDLEDILQLRSLLLLTQLSVAQRFPRREIAGFKKEQRLQDKGGTYQPALRPRKRSSRKDADPKHCKRRSKPKPSPPPKCSRAMSCLTWELILLLKPQHRLLTRGRPQAMLFFKPPPSAQAEPSPAKEEPCRVCVLNLFWSGGGAHRMAPGQGEAERGRGKPAVTQSGSQLPADTGKIFL